jgi:hypothetical protein
VLMEKKETRNEAVAAEYIPSTKQ